MMAIQVLFVAFAAFVVVTGDDSFCCTPRQWEGYQGVLAGVSAHNYAKLDTASAKLSYDADRQMVAASAFVTKGKFHNHFHLLLDFKHKKSFIASKGVCVIRPLKKQFRERCVPGNAKHLGAFSFGVGSNSITAESFHIRVPGHIFYVASVAPLVSEGNDQLCVPLSETSFGYYFGHHGPVKFLETVGFTNITAGIVDEHVFDVPKECTDKQELNSRLMFDINLETKSFFGI